MEKSVIWFIVAAITVIVIVIGLNSILFVNVKNGNSQINDPIKINQVDQGIENVQLTGERKEFEIIAKNWDFTPSIIKVNKGDKVKLKLKSIEGVHGFALFDFNINEALEPGKEVEIEFIADKSGKFIFFCNIPCGRGHGGMNGQLIVNE